MDREYAAQYRELYRRHWWWRSREAAVLAELRRRAPRHRPLRILDVGCGDGLLFDRLAPFGEIEGIEPDQRSLDPQGKWRRAINAAPFDASFRPEHRFDIILMLDVLEHLDLPGDALRCAGRLLAPGGFVLITVPAFSWLWTRHDDLNHHVRRFGRGELQALARKAGFLLERERYLFQWIVPAKLLIRGWERIRHGAPAIPTVPSAPLNLLAEGLTRLELAIARRLRFPAGGTLLLIASV
jgi:SAM-dependent methyltransferase